MSEYVLVGNHPEVLANGRMIGPGDRVKDFDAGDQWLVDEGRLVDVASFDPPKSTPAKTEA